MTLRGMTVTGVLAAALLGSAVFFAGCTGVLASSDVDRAVEAAEWVAGELSEQASPGAATDEAIGGVAPSQPLVPVVERAQVVRVVDGDTARFLMEDGNEEPVRFIGIDTPEDTQRKEPWGAEASEFTRSLLPAGTEVYLEFDAEARDRYDRLLAYVWLERPQGSHTAEVRFKMLTPKSSSLVTQRPSLSSRTHGTRIYAADSLRRRAPTKWECGIPMRCLCSSRRGKPFRSPVTLWYGNYWAGGDAYYLAGVWL